MCVLERLFPWGLSTLYFLGNSAAPQGVESQCSSSSTFWCATSTVRLISWASFPGGKSMLLYGQYD